MKKCYLLLLVTGLLMADCSKEGLPSDIQKSLVEATNYIGKFRTEHSHLPARDEYLIWSKTNELVGVADYKVDSTDTNEYRLSIWLGERMVLYSSKTKALSEANPPIQ